MSRHVGWRDCDSLVASQKICKEIATSLRQKVRLDSHGTWYTCQIIFDITCTNSGSLYFCKIVRFQNKVLFITRVSTEWI